MATRGDGNQDIEQKDAEEFGSKATNQAGVDKLLVVENK